MTIGIVGSGQMGSAIAHRMVVAGKQVVLNDTDVDKAARVAEQVRQLVENAGLHPVDAGTLDNARVLERMTALSIELTMRYETGFHSGFKYLIHSA